MGRAGLSQRSAQFLPGPGTGPPLLSGFRLCPWRERVSEFIIYLLFIIIIIIFAISTIGACNSRFESCASRRSVKMLGML